MIDDEKRRQLILDLEELGPDEVRYRLAQNIYNPDKAAIIEVWLEQKGKAEPLQLRKPLDEIVRVIRERISASGSLQTTEHTGPTLDILRAEREAWSLETRRAIGEAFPPHILQD